MLSACKNMPGPGKLEAERTRASVAADAPAKPDAVRTAPLGLALLAHPWPAAPMLAQGLAAPVPSRQRLRSA